MKKWFKKIGLMFVILFVLLNIISAFHAYKFTHFYDDASPIKKPEQMSAGEKAKAMFFGVNYPKSKVVDSLLIPHSTIKITTTDSLQLEAWYLQQPNINGDVNIRKGTVLMFHGHGSNKSAIIREAEEFYSLGYDVFTTDFRAHGNSAGNVCTIGFNESKDVKAVYDYIKAKGETNIILWGISLGASTITKAIYDYNIQPNKIILEMPFGSLSDAVKGRVRTMVLPEQPIATLLSFWGGTQQGFWAFSHNPSNYVKKINCPTLLQWGVLDARVTATETEELFNNLATSNKQWIKYENCGHVSLCKNENNKWKGVITSFLAP
ncbi:MAG: lysophospholipase [Chitinophagaceae bacterium]|jgi:hypothetical protein|nr:lysophospholipase [Chitinophagaceae bacterium]